MSTPISDIFPGVPTQQYTPNTTKMRQESNIWRHVVREPNPDSATNPIVTCTYCLFTWRSNSTKRLIKHMKQCPELPQELHYVFGRGSSISPKQASNKRARASTLGDWFDKPMKQSEK